MKRSETMHSYCNCTALAGAVIGHSYREAKTSAGSWSIFLKIENMDKSMTHFGQLFMDVILFILYKSDPC